MRLVSGSQRLEPETHPYFGAGAHNPPGPSRLRHELTLFDCQRTLLPVVQFPVIAHQRSHADGR